MSSITVYPDPDPETSTTDGWTGVSGQSETWAGLIALNPGDDAVATDADANFFWIQSTATTDRFGRLRRGGMYLFDTSAIGDTDTIDSAIFSVKGNGSKTDALAIAPNVNVYSASPATNTNIIAADFNDYGSTAFCDSAITYAGWDTGAYNNFTLNANGKAAVSKTGITKLSLRNANYDVAALAPTWADSASSNIGGIFADTADTTSDPKLVVEYSAGASTAIKDPIGRGVVPFVRQSLTEYQNTVQL